MPRIIISGGCILMGFILFSCRNDNIKGGNRIREEIVQDNVIKPASLQMLKHTADSLYNQDNYKDAILYLDTLIGLDSSNGEYYFKRGYSNGMLLKRKEAIKDYQKSIDLNYRVADAYFNAGLNSSFDDDSLALIYFKKCLKVSPEYPKLKREIMECEKRLAKAKEGLKLRM